MGNPFLEKRSTQLILVIVVVAFLCNAAVSHTDDGLPWEVTLSGACVLGVVFSAHYIQKTDVALSIVSILALLVPTYYVHNAEVECKNWALGSQFSLTTTRGELLEGVWRASPNASRFDKVLPLGLSVFQMSAFMPGIAITANTSEVYHSGMKLSDKLTGEQTHEYLLISSPRKVRRKTTGVMILARVPYHFDVWPKEETDYTFDLQTAAHIVAPPTFYGELIKLDMGPAIVSLQNKHNLRPFMLDVYKVEYHYGARG